MKRVKVLTSSTPPAGWLRVIQHSNIAQPTDYLFLVEKKFSYNINHL